jgi:O-antigen/teichoic acid export membrane protein
MPESGRVSLARVEMSANKTRKMSGVRAGMIVFVGIACANLGNYLFQLIAARSFGPGQYGDLAALMAVAALITLPLGGIQAAVAREVATLDAEGRHALAAARVRRALRLALVAGCVAAAVLMLFSGVIRQLLDVTSLPAVVMTMALVTPALLMPLLLGWLQGEQRFGLLSATLSIGPLVRIALLVVVVVAGKGVAGAVGATLVASAAALVLPLGTLLGKVGRGIPKAAGQFDWMTGISRSFPVIVGLLALTALSTIDVVVANITLDGNQAGIYSSASLIARVILYLSAAIVTVLLPKVSERSALHLDTRAILSMSLLATGVLAALATVIYAVFSSTIVLLTVGGKYADAAPLLWIFALAMSGYALLNVLLFNDLGRGGTGMVKLLLAGTLGQLAGYAVFHASVWQLVTVSATSAAFLLLAHELLVDPSILRAARSAPTIVKSFHASRRRRATQAS